MTTTYAPTAPFATLADLGYSPAADAPTDVTLPTSGLDIKPGFWQCCDNATHALRMTRGGSPTDPAVWIAACASCAATYARTVGWPVAVLAAPASTLGDAAHEVALAELHQEACQAEWVDAEFQCDVEPESMGLALAAGWAADTLARAQAGTLAARAGLAVALAGALAPSLPGLAARLHRLAACTLSAQADTRMAATQAAAADSHRTALWNTACHATQADRSAALTAYSEADGDAQQATADWEQAEQAEEQAARALVLALAEGTRLHRLLG